MNRDDQLSYVKKAIGTVTVQGNSRYVSLMVDTSKAPSPDDWDEAISEAWDMGWELNHDAPTEVVGSWEFWDLDPIDTAA